MAGAAFRRIAEHLSFVENGLLLHMTRGSKISVDMATAAIVVDGSVAVHPGHIVIKGLLDWLGITTQADPNQDHQATPSQLEDPWTPVTVDRHHHPYALYISKLYRYSLYPRITPN